MQQDPYASIARPVGQADPYAGIAAPVAPAPAPARQPAPDGARMPTRAPAPASAAPAPSSTVGDSGLTRDEIYSAQRAQGFTDDEIAANIEQMFPEMGGGAPVGPSADLNQHIPENYYLDSAAALARPGPAYTGPGSSADNPFMLREVVPGSEEDFDQRRAAANLTQGMFVQQPDGSVGRLTGDAYTNENAANDQGMGGVTTRERNLGDQARAFGMAAAEQIPFLDEAAVGAAGLISGRGYSDVRDSYQALQAIDNQTNRGQRIAGGFTGAATGLLAPGGSFLKGSTGLLNASLRSAALGTGYGALYGAAGDEGGITDRVDGFVGGAVAGGLLGGAVPGAVNLGRSAIQRGASGFAEAGARVKRGFGFQPGEAEITRETTESALDFAQRLAAGSGRSLDGNEIAAMGKPITSAEALGPNGVSQMTALIRRSGRSAGLAEDALGARAADQSSRILQDFADITGADPAGSADIIANLAATGRRNAAPLYRAYNATQIEQSPLIENILRRPIGRKALRAAYEIARNEGRNPEELGMFIVERNEPRQSGLLGGVPKDAELAADLDAMRSGRRTQGAGRGETLLSFISKNGGIRDEGGELAQIGADTWNRQGAWRSRAVRDDGLSLEQMADRARAAGYFPDVVDATADGADNYQRLSSQDIINAIDDELRGNPMYARAVGDTNRSAGAAARTARRDALEERLNREGIDISKMSNDDVARALANADDAEARAMAFLNGDAPGAPMVDFLPGETPTAETLDLVKRGMDNVIEGYRDGTTRRLNLTPAGQAELNALTQFRGELIRLTGGKDGTYAQALSAGGDPIRLEEAFNQAGRLFGTGVNERAFAQRIEKMGEADRGALIAGLVDDLYTKARNGRLRPNQLTIPSFEGKLSQVLGPERARSLIARLQAEVVLGRGGGRMAPGTNSTTGEVIEAMRDQDRGVGFGADLARNIEQSGPVGGLLRTGADMFVAPISGFVRGAQAPAPQGVRDEIGRLLLMPPEELRGLLSNRPQPRVRGLGAPAVAGQSGGLLAQQMPNR